MHITGTESPVRAAENRENKLLVKVDNLKINLDIWRSAPLLCKRAPSIGLRVRAQIFVVSLYVLWLCVPVSVIKQQNTH